MAINRDVLGYLRRALKMGADPLNPALIGVIQPTVPALVRLNENIRQVRFLNQPIGAAAIEVTIPITQSKREQALIIQADVTISSARTLSVRLDPFLDQVGIQHTFYNGAIASLHMIVGGGGTSSSVRTLLVPAPSVVPGNLILSFGAGAVDTFTLAMMICFIDADDPTIPLGL